MTETNITLHPGDNRESLRRLIDQGVRVHSVVTDPPYGLTSITKRFGKGNAAPALSNGATGVFKRASGGFMGQQWDGSGIERDPEFWRLIYDILLPGGYVLAFSSPRTGHWQACAMETAGFIMHPFFGWVYGSGFPKAHNAGRAVEAQMLTGGAAPKNIRTVEMGDDYRPHELAGTEGYGNGRGGGIGKDKDRDYTARPELTTPEAQQWEGWAYGAQSMKPALEPVYFGQKPFSEKNGALNLLKHGVGAVNIDGCRVALNGEAPPTGSGKHSEGRERTNEGGALRGNGGNISVAGRHPANLIHDDSDDAKAQFPNDSARFFNGFPFEADPLFYQAKATKADRAGSKHPTVKPVALMQHFVRLVTPPGGVVLDPFGGSGTTAEAARREGFDCILMEADDQYIADIRSRFGLPAPAADGFYDLFDTSPEDSDSDFESIFA